MNSEKKYSILVVDDDRDLCASIKGALSSLNYELDEACDGIDAISKIKSMGYDLVLLDIDMPRMNGISALYEIKKHDPTIIVIMITAFTNVKDAVEAVRAGAYNYISKPVKYQEIQAIVERAIKAHQMIEEVLFSAPVLKLGDEREFVARSNEMQRIFELIDKLAKYDTTVLVRGESGTGKELIARAIHFNSPRKDEKFVTVDCSAIPENLIESELFGHEKGAFTGADQRKIGKFQYADQGTIFLDEIADLPLSMQVKLLRIIQEKRFTPVGSNREIEVNVRIVAATNRNIEKMIEEEKFREDLYYRLSILPIFLPPLRDRKGEIDHLVLYFIKKFNEKYGEKIKSISKEAINCLKKYNWPGNIRELENVIERVFIVENGCEITSNVLPASILGKEKIRKDEEVLDFNLMKEKFERDFIISALKSFNGRINQTAIHANIPKKTLLRKLAKYKINPGDYK